MWVCHDVAMSRPYNSVYQRERAELLRNGPMCALRLACRGDRADSADHQPPLSMHEHVAGTGCCVLIPACLRCQHKQAGTISRQLGLGWWKPKKRFPRPSRSW